jgi:PAS domain S-box-containing protein
VDRLVLFLAISSLMIWVVEVLRRNKEIAERNALLAEERSVQVEHEAAQRAREERFSAQLRAIVESSEDAITSNDLNGEIQSWNRGAEHVFGYAAGEAIGQPVNMLLPLDRVHEELEIMERIRSGGRVKHFETVRLRKDGAPIDVSLTVSPIRDPHGNITGASHIARDITERKRLEEQFRETQKLESLGVLAGGLAHDFNNLLTGIMGNTSLAMADSDLDRIRERLTEVLQASERATQLVRQMLAFAGKGRFILEPLDLSAQVREILPLLKTSTSKLVDIQLSLADNLPPVEGDRSQVQQLIMNLALNAVEAVGDRPGFVRIVTSHGSADTGRRVTLQVIDNGVGMTEEVKSRIFDPFYSTKFTGRGLGLSAAMGIIRSHRGDISVSTIPEKGSTFTVVLPAVAGPAQRPAPVSDDELHGFGLVLVADDEELVRKMAKFTLERYGYAIETAADGRDALGKFEERPAEFTAVLLDLTMPEMGGEEVLRAIRRIRGDVPVILSSGYTEAEAVPRFQDLRLSGFLQKPYTATALAKKIKQALRSSN